MNENATRFGRLGRRDGFALPITIFLVAILTVMLSSAFARATSDRQVADASEAGVDALSIAQSGLEEYFSMTLPGRPTMADSMRINANGGYAWIVPMLVRTPADTLQDHRYVVRSTGYAVDPLAGPTPLGVRTIAQFADWQTAWTSAPNAAIIAANGLHALGGGAKEIQGVDFTTCGASYMPTGVIGARVPVDTTSLAGASVMGTPPVVRSGTNLTVADLTGVSWSEILAGEFDADYNQFRNFDFSFPSQIVNGNFTPANFSMGTGILIVTGDMTVPGFYFYFRGLILVGGRLKISGTYNYMYGTVMTGLNYQGGAPAPLRSEIGGPGVIRHRIRFRSCDIQLALRSLEGFVPLENTLVDNWASY